VIPSARTWARRSAELLDDPAADGGEVLASLGDVVRVNRLFGGVRAALARLDEFFRDEDPARTLSLLDVGTGLGDIPVAAARRARRHGLTLRLVGVERHPAAARAARNRHGLALLLADAGRLPFRDGAVDFVLCSQLLHHFDGAAATRLVAELDRVARRGVVVSDLRRSALAAAGLFLVSFPLRFHPATRRDGVVSVFRGFTPRELGAVCRSAGVAARVRRHAGFRVTAAWRKNGGPP
jgi:SAM-dependent methyltransferase